MSDTIAVPRETLERWRKVAADAVEIGLTRRVDYLADEIRRVLAQPDPVETDDPVPVVLRERTEASLGEIAADAPSPVAHTRLPDDDLVWREKTVPHKWQEGMLRVDVENIPELVTRGEVWRKIDDVMDDHRRECHPQPPNCINWSKGEGWCVHGLKPCDDGCSFKVPREVKG